MTTIKKSILSFACLMAVTAAHAAAGHIYDIRPYSMQEKTILSGPVSSVSDPMTGGDTAYIAVRFAPEAENCGKSDASYKWKLQCLYASSTSETLCHYSNPLRIGIYVSGELREATLVWPGGVVPSAEGSDYTDFIFEYTVKPGDFALPIVLAMADGSPATGSKQETVAYWVGGTLDWRVVNGIDDTTTSSGRQEANFWFGTWTFPKPSGAADPDNDYDLRLAGFYAKTVDFDDDWEQPKTADDAGVWRSVHEGSVETLTTPPTLALPVAATNSVTLHVWSDDSSAFIVKGDGAYDVVMTTGWSGGEALVVTNRVLDIKITAGLTSIPFDIYGVNSNKTANLILSASTNYNYNSSKMRFTDYISVPVKCVERLPASVVLTTDDELEEVNVDANYKDPVGSMTLRAATGYTNDMTVTVTPRLRDGTPGCSNYLHLAKAKSANAWMTTDPCTLTFSASDLTSQLSAQKTIYLYAMGADAHTSLAEGGIVFDITLDAEAAKYYEVVTSEAVLWLKPTAPVITAPTEGESLQASGNVAKEFEISVSDSYKNTCNTNVGYEIWFRQSSDESYAKLEPKGKWVIGTDGYLCDSGDGNALPSTTYTTMGTYETQFYVKAPDGTTKSAARTVAVEVSAPAKIWLTTDLANDEGTEGTNAYVTVHLSKAAKGNGTNPIYAFLVPLDEDSSNLVANCTFLAKAGAKGIKILSGATTSTGRWKMTFTDGVADGTQLSYDVVLRKSQTYSEAKADLVEGYQSETYMPLVYNVRPHVKQAKMRGLAATASNWYTAKATGATIGSVSAGVTNIFNFSVYEPGAIDLSITNEDKRFQLQYNIEESNGSGTSDTLYGDPAKTNFTYAFGVIGTAKITLQVRDKDMIDSDEWSDEFVFYVNVTEDPSITITRDSGTFEFYENNVGASITKMTLGLSASATEALDVEISVKPSMESDNPGTLKLGGCTETSNGFYKVTFARGQTTQTIWVDDADGTKASAKGFIVTPRVISPGKNKDGRAWSEFYKYESYFFTVANVPPSITTSLGAENVETNGISVAIGDGEPITWSVDDIAIDLGVAGGKTNITVVWKSPGKTNETYYANDTSDHTYTPSFNASGNQSVTVTVTDKDADSGSGTTTKTWWYKVESSKTLVAYPVGPSAGTTTIADKYHSLRGCGEGHIYAAGATFKDSSMFRQNWNCKLTGEAELYAWGYKVGNPKDDGSLDGGYDMPLGPSGATPTDDQRAAKDYYVYPDTERDSFLYLWVKYGADTTSGSSADSASIGKIAMETWDGSSTTKSGAYSPTLPTQADQNGTYAKTFVEAIFSKEYLPTDNMGDINFDGLPDLYVKYYKFDVFDATTGELTGDDTARLDNYNDDGDYLPGKKSGVYSYFVPASTNTAAISAGSPFTAVQELRGGYQDSTSYWSGLNDACDSTLVNITGVKVDRIYEDPSVNTTNSTLTKLEYAAFCHWCAVQSPALDPADKANWTKWSPERPTDPLVWDSDSDNMSDGYEYYYWYRAHVGYMDGTNHVFMTGRRFNPKQPCIPDAITSADIEEAMDPTVFLNHAETDTDNDGLSDLEEAELGTNPFDFDTDADGLPDGYEVVITGTDPLVASGDAELNADGDSMAYHLFTQTSSADERWNVVPVGADGFLCSPTALKVAETAPGVTNVVAESDDAAVYTAWLYSGTTNNLSSALFCRGRRYFFPENYTNLVVSGNVTTQSLIAIHFHVYQMLGFEPRTAWNVTPYYPKHLVDTTPFTARDEFLLQAFFYHAGGMRGTELVASDDKPMTTLWLEQTTCPTLHPRTKSGDEGAFEENADVHGADTDADGMPDGWELYLMAGPETKPSAKERPTNVATDAALKSLCRPGSMFSPLVSFAYIAGTTAADDDSATTIDESASEVITDPGDGLDWPHEFSGIESSAVYSNCTTIVNLQPTWKNKIWPTDPWNLDTDGDGIKDGQEFTGTTRVEPFVYGENDHESDNCEDCVAGGGLNPLSWDTDRDGLPDPWEAEFNGTYTSGEDGGWNNDGMDGTVNDAMKDYDFDGLLNWQEYFAGTLRHFRYDDSVSQFGHQSFTGVAASEDDAEAWGEFWYKLLVDDGSETTGITTNFNPNLIGVTQMGTTFDGASTYFSYCTNKWEEIGSVKGKWYYFRDGIYHDLLTPPADKYWIPAKGADDAVQYNRFTYRAALTWMMPPYATKFGSAQVAPLKYICCDPRLADTDDDGMDDYYELFHGLNPLLGATGVDGAVVASSPRDVIFDAYENGDQISRNTAPTAENNWWLNAMTRHPFQPERINGDSASSSFDFACYPWLAGLAQADPDGDDIRNQKEAILPSMQAVATYLHTDPTPLWMTDSSYDQSFPNRYYNLLPMTCAVAVSLGASATGTFTYKGVTYKFTDFPGFSWNAETKELTFLFDNNRWQVSQYVYSFEENEGFDSDHDYLSDSREGEGRTKPASDPQDHDDPIRRQAMWFNGTDAFLETPPEEAETPPYTIAASEPRENYLYFTVEAWVKPDPSTYALPNNRQVIVERAIYTGEAGPDDASYVRKNFMLAINDGRWYAGYDSSGTASERIEITQGPSATTNWTHLAATYDGAKLVLYVNGIACVTKSVGREPEHGMCAASTDQTGGIDVNSQEWTTSAFLVGASAKSRCAHFIDYYWRYERGGFLFSGPHPQISDYQWLYRGYIDEVRVWDGARSAADILDDYKNRVRYDATRALANREKVYAQWKKGARRTPTSSLVLPAQLMHHWTFDHLPGAVDAADVSPTPAGFSTDGSVTDAKARWVRPEGWSSPWWESLTLKTSVYSPENDWLPWINDTVAHLPRLDQTTVDSVYWSADFAGNLSAKTEMRDSFAFPRSAEVYSKWTQMLYSTGTGVEGSPYNQPTRWEMISAQADSNELQIAYHFTIRNRNVTGDDLLPMGGAYPKRIGEDEGGMWDEQGVSDPWAETGVDSNNDGLPDWWTRYALEYYNLNEDPTATISWETLVRYRGSRLTAGEAYLRDLARGMLPDSEYHANLANTTDVDNDGMWDWWENLFEGINTQSATDAFADPDGDGLSNYEEFLISERENGGQGYYLLKPTLAKSVSEASVIDYYLQITNGTFHVGEYLGEVYADHDFIEDWWEDKFDVDRQNRYVYDALGDSDDDGWSNWSEARAKTDPTRIATLGADNNYLPEHPVPLVTVTVAADKDTTVPTDAQLVFMAWHNDSTTLKPDAIWTATQDATTEKKELYLGVLNAANSTYEFDLSPGSVTPGSILFKYYDPLDGKLTITWQPSSTKLFGDIADSADQTKGYIIDYSTTSNGTGNIVHVGTVDYLTGRVLLDLVTMEERMGSQLDTYYWKAQWTSAIPARSLPTTFYLKDPEETSANSKGRLREGLNNFLVFFDKDTDGQLSEGEPYGVIRNVDVGWDATEALNVFLTDKPTCFERIAVASTNASESVRIVRTAINGQSNGTSRVVWSKKIDAAQRDWLTELDCVRGGQYDVDWNRLASDAAKSGQKDFTSVDYAIYVGSDAEPTTTYTRLFESSRSQPLVSRDGTNSYYLVHTVAPTLAWTGTDGYTAFAVQIAADRDFADIVYDSGTRFLPPAALKNYYVFNPEAYVGQELKDGTVYFWRVAQMNAKFTKPEGGWSATASFRTAVNVDERNTGYGRIAADIRYYGPSKETFTNVVVAVYPSRDFSGTPLARRRLGTDAPVSSLAAARSISYADVFTNVVFEGLAPTNCYVMAFIDSNTNGVRDAYESWGYVCNFGKSTVDYWDPVAIVPTVVKTGKPASDILVIEDTDVNQNECPDCLEDMTEWATDADSEDIWLDTDGDQMPAGWESDFAGTDPEIYDAEDAAANDVMAFAKIDAVFLTLTNGETTATFRLDPSVKTVPQVGDEVNGLSVWSTYEYPVSEDGQIVNYKGIGTNLVVSGWRVASVDSESQAVLVHNQVYQEFGFDSTTATTATDAKNTKSFTALDKYLLIRYRDALGLLSYDHEAYDSPEKYVAARGKWADYTLPPNETDADADGIPDGWELYMMFGKNGVLAGSEAFSPWNYSDARAVSPGDRSLSSNRCTNLMEYGLDYDGKAHPTDPWQTDTDGDTVSDYYYHRYHLWDPTGDPDGDGLSNYAEYLATEVFAFATCDPDEYATTDSSGQAVCDYYKKVGSLYLGEMFTDHDRVDDAWERLYDGYADASKYDPARDEDGDGWSNWAEAKAGTNPSLTYSQSVDSNLPEFPVPVVKATVRYAGTVVGQMNFRAWSETNDPHMVKTPDAAWSSEVASTNTVKYVGKNPGKETSYHLGTGLVTPGSLRVWFRDVRCQDVYLYNGAEISSVVSTQNSRWFYFIEDGCDGYLYTVGSTNSISANVNGSYKVGTVDYDTGLVTVDFSQLPAYYYDRWTNGEGSNDGKNQAVYSNAIRVNLADSYVRIEYTPSSSVSTGNRTYYLSDSFGPTEKLDGKTVCNGHVREGKTSFLVWCDQDGGTAGVYDPGEPFGYAKGVDVGWQGAEFEVTISETCGITPRFNLWSSSSNDRNVTMNETTANMLEDRIRTTNHPKYTNLVEVADAQNEQVRVRIVRFGINHIYAYACGVGFADTDDSPNPIVIDRTYNLKGRKFLCEADFLQDGEFDLDWSRLEPEIPWRKDVRNSIGSYWEDASGNVNEEGDGEEISGITNITYLAVLEGGSGCEYWIRGSDDTNTVIKCLGTPIERRFELVKHAPVAGSMGGIVSSARPTFRWSLPNEEAGAKKYGTTYTAFKLQIYDETGTTKVYDSGVRCAPAQKADGSFEWTAECSAGDLVAPGCVFAATGNYQWRVAMYNAKFKPQTAENEAKEKWSEKVEFAVAVNGTHEMNENGYSSIDVAVKYAGPSEVLANYQYLGTMDNKVRIQAFATGDFAGVPLAEAVVDADVGAVSDTSANVRLVGLPRAGTYYLRAYIDSNGNHALDDWESWGAASEQVTLTATTVTAPVATVWIEDSDTDQDWLPDAWEFVKFGNLTTQGANVKAVNATIFSSASFARAVNANASNSTYMDGAVLTIFENGSYAKVLLNWGNDASDITFYDIQAAVQKELSLASETFRITSMAIKGNLITLKVDADVASESVGSELLAKTYTIPMTKSVNIRVMEKDSLAQENWEQVGDDITVTFGEGEQTATAEILGNLGSAFYKVEIVE